MSVSFIPFPTRVVAEHLRSADERQAAALIYGISMTVMSVLFLSLWLYASAGRRLLRRDAEPREVDGITRSFVPGAPTYTGATLLALVSPITSLAVFAGLAVFYMLSSSLFGRD
jgi:uncharacterized membrane protein